MTVATEPLPVPWPSDFEVEVRRELADIRAHQLRQDKLLMDLQLEQRQAARAQGAKMDELLRLLRTNGHA